jgi:hypothetical protein
VPGRRHERGGGLAGDRGDLTVAPVRLSRHQHGGGGRRRRARRGHRGPGRRAPAGHGLPAARDHAAARPGFRDRRAAAPWRATDQGRRPHPVHARAGDPVGRRPAARAGADGAGAGRRLGPAGRPRATAAGAHSRRPQPLGCHGRGGGPVSAGLHQHGAGGRDLRPARDRAGTAGRAARAVGCGARDHHLGPPLPRDPALRLPGLDLSPAGLRGAAVRDDLRRCRRGPTDPDRDRCRYRPLPPTVRLDPGAGYGGRGPGPAAGSGWWWTGSCCGCP